jgi:uncharacterized protein (TIGR02300 family)
MATKAARGTKRTCQNPECGSRFYDLNKDPIVCPICQSVYKIASAPQGVAPPVVEDRARKPKKPEVVSEPGEASPDTPVAEGEDALVDIEAADETIAADDEETFIEPEEEDGGDVSGILGGSVSEDEEET